MKIEYFEPGNSFVIDFSQDLQIFSILHHLLPVGNFDIGLNIQQN